MRSRYILALAAAASSYLAVPQASASLLFSSGAYNGTINGWDVSNTSAGSPANNIADNFILSSESIVTGASFFVWANPGTTMTTVDYAITSTAGGIPIASGTAAVTQSLKVTSTIYGYNLDRETFTISPSVDLIAGTYWLELENADDIGGDDFFWDENDNPKNIPGLQAWDASLNGGAPEFLDPTGDPADCDGGPCTQTFRITGTSATPEPASSWLFSSGIFGIAAILIARRFAAAALIAK